MYTRLEMELAKKLFNELFISREDAINISCKYIRSKDYAEITSNTIIENVKEILENLDLFY